MQVSQSQTPTDAMLPIDPPGRHRFAPREIEENREFQLYPE
jgi:hypothetical protein